MKRTVILPFLAVLVLAFLFTAQTSEGAKPNHSPYGKVRVKMTGGKNFTPEQREFLQNTLDRLCDLGCEKTARILNGHIQKGNVSFGKLVDGTRAEVGPKSFGYLDPRDNNLVISEDTFNQWLSFKEFVDKMNKKGNKAAEKKYQNRCDHIQTSMAFTMIHEMVHMTQYCPAQTPKYEDPAYTRQFAESKRVIEDFKKRIEHIMNNKMKNKDDADKLEWLVKNTKMVLDDYNVSVNSMLGKEGVIEKGKVTRDKFKDTKKDKDAVVSDIKGLLNDARKMLNDPGLKTSGIVLPGSVGKKWPQNNPGVPLASGTGSAKTPDDKKVAQENWDKVYEGWNKVYEGWDKVSK